MCACRRRVVRSRRRHKVGFWAGGVVLAPSAGRAPSDDGVLFFWGVGIWLVVGCGRNCNGLTSTSTAVSPPLRGGDLLFCLAKKVGKKGAPDGATPPRDSTKRAAGTQTRIALRRYSDMGPSFPLFSSNPEAPHTASEHLHGSLRIARGCFPPGGGKHGYHRGIIFRFGVAVICACGRKSPPRDAKRAVCLSSPVMGRLVGRQKERKRGGHV